MKTTHNTIIGMPRWMFWVLFAAVAFFFLSPLAVMVARGGTVPSPTPTLAPTPTPTPDPLAEANKQIKSQQDLIAGLTNELSVTKAELADCKAQRDAANSSIMELQLQGRALQRQLAALTPSPTPSPAK